MSDRSDSDRLAIRFVPGLFPFLCPLFFACSAPAFSNICSSPDNATEDQRKLAECACSSSTLEQVWGTAGPRQVDVLFVIDNSSGMAENQQVLAQNLDQLIRIWEGANYHFGVVTTDVGSWVEAGVPWTMSAGACDSFAGDDGKLQAISCLDRQGNSAAASQACSALCPDRRYLPTDGTRFVSYANHKSNVPAALEVDAQTGQMVDRGPLYALRCMAMVGDSGCQLSSPLEAMKRALDGHAAENSGFLRENSRLAIVIVTDKDDCSVEMSRRSENDPHTTNCSTPDASANPSCFDPRYRCLARNLACDQPMNSAGPKTGCHERSDSYLTPWQSYVDLIKTLQTDRRQVDLAGIIPLPSIPNGGSFYIEQNPNISGSAGLHSAQDANATCSQSPTRYGQAQLRLSSFFLAAKEWRLSQANACNWSINDLGDLFSNTSSGSWGVLCLEKTPATGPDGQPRCLVGDVPVDDVLTSPSSYWPTCSAPCCGAMATGFHGGGYFDDATVAACLPEPADCYCILPKSPGSCENWGLLQADFWRKGYCQSPPPWGQQSPG